ncbi:MAG: hypothetical protein IKB71_11820 [Lentisphaeria bacterium]|nr:hypothetical protein [Lentisphaeria bacterium]
MDIYEKIIEMLKHEYNSGATYQELADKYNVSYTHIHNLLNGKRAVSGISLEFFFRMFPHATINFSGGDFSHLVNNGGNVVGINNGKITSGCLSAVIDKILESEELSDAEKIKVMKVLKK